MFMDLRQKGHPYEKKYIEFTPEDIKSFAKTYHDWKSIDFKENYKDIKEYCSSVNKKDLVDYSLITSKYIAFESEHNKQDYSDKMFELKNELDDLYYKENKSKEHVMKIMEELNDESKSL